MGIKKYRPITPTLRYKMGYTFDEITTSRPYKKLSKRIPSTGGRNNAGRITAWHRGGGHKRIYRTIDFKRDKINVPAKVISIEYDPNRSSRIALIQYIDGEKRYILCPLGLKLNDAVVSSDEKIEAKIGVTMRLKHIPLGTFIHNVELVPGKGAQLARSAGAAAQLAAKEGDFVHLRLPSKEIRRVRMDCRATIGQISNVEHEGISLGKAGRKRWMRRRPIVRGVAMNPVDHPLGGGEGKANGGRQHCSPWALLEGTKTRKKTKYSDRLIVQRRSK